MRKTRNNIHRATILLLVALTIMVAGCRSSKQQSALGGITMKEIKNLPAVKAGTECLSAKVKLSADIKGNDFSASGNIKIKRGEGIVISVNALGGFIEVARIEITPEEALFIYRLGRKYASARYSEVEAFRELGLDYRVLEAILLNEVFSTDGTSAEKSIENMDITTANGELILSADGKRIGYSFHIQPAEGNLVLTRGSYAGRLDVDCNYSDFVATDSRPFPSRIHFSVEDMSLKLQLSSIKNASFKINRTTDLSGYDRMDISALLKTLNQ